MRRPISILAALTLAIAGACSSNLTSAGGGGTSGGGRGEAGNRGGLGGQAGGGGGIVIGGAGGLDGGQKDGPSHDGAGRIDGPCWTQSDCTIDGICTPPGGAFCQGVCELSNQLCQIDSDCATFDAATSAPLVCDPQPCGCGASKACQAGCSIDADCPLGASCGGDHRCAPTVCAVASQACPAGFACGATCPVDFTCGSSGVCVRKACTQDGQCSKACVLGACYSGPGLCHGDTA